MKKMILIVFLAVSVCGCSSCTKIAGDGPTVVKDYSLSGFTSVDNGIDGDVFINQGTDFKVEVQAQQNIIDQIQTNIVNGVLQIRFVNNISLGVHNNIVFNVTMPTVTGLSLSGSGRVLVQQPLKVSNISLDISGSGDMTLSSLAAQNLDAEISGAGNINVTGDTLASESDAISGSGNLNLQNIHAATVSANISGSGNAKVYAIKSLDVHISGSGDVMYDGNPVVNSSISGSGRVSHF